jgi:hypothetical protein
LEVAFFVPIWVAFVVAAIMGAGLLAHLIVELFLHGWAVV